MNKALLEYEMKMHNISIGEMCKALSISRSAFYRKCCEKSQFTQKEIQTITSLLGLESPVPIFFNDLVS